jgi:hypothetical protein
MKLVSKTLLLTALAMALTLSASQVFAGSSHGGGGMGSPGGARNSGSSAVADHPTQVNSSGSTHTSNSGTKPKTQSKVAESCWGTGGGHRKCAPNPSPIPQTGTNGPSHGGVDNPSLKPK